MIATISRSAEEPNAAAGPLGDSVLSALLPRPYPAVMGVLNVTPDSFSDGGKFSAPERALAQARRMVAEGADIIDIGAESTRPYGSEPITSEEELNRLREVLPEIVALGIPVSIDSMKSSVVAWALDHGARIANDVWGLQRDPDMAGLVAARAVPVIIMHNRDRADPAIDIMKDVADFFARSLAVAAKAGIPPDNIVLDPGIGFGKTVAQNFALLARQRELLGAGHPLLLGWSRKSSIGAVTGIEQAAQRRVPSVAAAVLAVDHGAAIVRVHDVRDTVAALAVWRAMKAVA